MKKLLCLIILLFSFIRSEAQSDHICPHEKLYVHTDRANYERGDTVRFRAYLMDTRREATAYSRYVYAELLADSQVISREMVKDDHGVFSGYLSLGDTLRSGNYTLRFYTRYLSSLPAPRYFYRQIIVGGRPFQDYRKESVTRMAASYHVSFFPEGGRLPSGCVSRVAFKVWEQMCRALWSISVEIPSPRCVPSIGGWASSILNLFRVTAIRRCAVIVRGWSFAFHYLRRILLPSASVSMSVRMTFWCV